MPLAYYLDEDSGDEDLIAALRRAGIDIQSTGRHHAGIVLMRQRQFGIGERARRLGLNAGALSPRQMQDRYESQRLGVASPVRGRPTLAQRPA